MIADLARITAARGGRGSQIIMSIQLLPTVHRWSHYKKNIKPPPPDEENKNKKSTQPLKLKFSQRKKSCLVFGVLR
jgi:hypothetical protein